MKLQMFKLYYFLQGGGAAGLAATLTKGVSGRIAAVPGVIKGAGAAAGRPEGRAGVAAAAARSGDRGAADGTLVATLRVSADQDGRPAWARDGVSRPGGRAGSGGGTLGRKPPTPDVNLQLTSQNDWYAPLAFAEAKIWLLKRVGHQAPDGCIIRLF